MNWEGIPFLPSSYIFLALVSWVASSTRRCNVRLNSSRFQWFRFNVRSGCFGIFHLQPSILVLSPPNDKWSFPSLINALQTLYKKPFEAPPFQHLETKILGWNTKNFMFVLEMQSSTARLNWSRKKKVKKKKRKKEKKSTCKACK